MIIILNIDKLLDRLWAIAILIKAGHKCEKCGKLFGLCPHHIFSRRTRSVRGDLDDGICLCNNCHTGDNYSAHRSRKFTTIWIKNYIGEEKYYTLERKANQVKKWTNEEKKKLVKKLKEFIKEDIR